MHFKSLHTTWALRSWRLGKVDLIDDLNFGRKKKEKK